jgi:cytosolic carboxypeptidase protein 6
VTISSPANLVRDAAVTSGRPLAVDGVCRPVFVISSRVHPGESPASLLMHGLLSFLTSSHPKAVALREKVIIKVSLMLVVNDGSKCCWAGYVRVFVLLAVLPPMLITHPSQLVPMLNPDGVFLGNYRCSSLGLDLNRLWHTPVSTVAPTIHRVRACGCCSRIPVAVHGALVPSTIDPSHLYVS